MTIQELGSIGELLGALATIVTLAYLATQIRQNTKAARVSSLQHTLDGGRDHTIQPLLTNQTTFLESHPDQPSLLEIMPVMDARQWESESA